MPTATATAAPPPLDFRAVYRAHYAHVWRTLRRLGVPERNVEDAAHDVFLVVHRRLDDFDPARPVGPWLTGIAYRVAADHRRRARRKPEQVGVPEAIDACPDPVPGPEACAQQRERQRLVLRALDAVCLEQRLVFIMHELDGVPCPQIAETVGAPLNTVYSRLRLARTRFAQAVRDLRAEGGAP